MIGDIHIHRAPEAATSADTHFAISVEFFNEAGSLTPTSDRTDPPSVNKIYSANAHPT